MNASYANCGDYVIMYANVKSLCWTHEINMYMSIIHNPVKIGLEFEVEYQYPLVR